MIVFALGVESFRLDSDKENGMGTHYLVLIHHDCLRVEPRELIVSKVFPTTAVTVI